MAIDTVKRLAVNTVSSLVYQISTPVSSFVLVLFIAKYMRAEGLGQFSSGLSLLLVFQCIASLGFPYLITREVSRCRSLAWKMIVNSSVIGSVLSLGAVLCMCVAIHLLTDDAETIRATYVLSFALLPITLGTICESICRAYERIDYIAASWVIGNLFRVGLGVYVLMSGYGIYHLNLVVTASYVVIMFCDMYFVYQSVPRDATAIGNLDWDFCKWIVWSSPVFTLILLAAALRANMDTLLLTKFMKEADVGIYSAGNKLVNIFRLGASSYVMALQPVIFRLSESEKERFERVAVESIRYLFIMIIPIIVFVMFLSDNIVLFIFKKEFLPTASVLSILIWMVLLYGLNQIYANIIISNNDQTINLLGNIASASTCILLNVLMIPRFGYIGSAIASLISYTVILLIQDFVVQRRYFPIHYGKLLWKPVLSSVIMGGILYLCKTLSLLLLVPIAAVGFLFPLLALKTFSQEDVDIFKRLLPFSKNKVCT